MEYVADAADDVENIIKVGVKIYEKIKIKITTLVKKF